MDRNEVKEIINSELKKFVNDALDIEIKKIIQKSGTQSRNELISTIKNAFESVYKILWTKRDFWKVDIK